MIIYEGTIRAKRTARATVCHQSALPVLELIFLLRYSITVKTTKFKTKTTNTPKTVG